MGVKPCTMVRLTQTPLAVTTGILVSCSAQIELRPARGIDQLLFGGGDLPVVEGLLEIRVVAVVLGVGHEFGRR